VFVLVPAHPGNPGQRAIKRWLLLLLKMQTALLWSCGNHRWAEHMMEHGIAALLV